VWVASEGGLLVPTTSLPFEPQKAIDYFAMVAQGLLWSHFGQLLGEDYGSTSSALTHFGVEEFRRRFWPNDTTDGVSRSLAKGALWYAGRQAKDNRNASVWFIRLYDGIEMRGAGRDKGVSADMFVAMTLKQDTLRSVGRGQTQ
jgi:hypothetical protein